MIDHRKHQSGFSVVVVIATIVILTLVGGLGWLAYDNFVNKADDTENDTKSNSQTSQKSPAPSSSPEAEQATGTVITTGDSEFGTMLFNDKKQAIYIWEVEKSEKPLCYDNCEAAWPPVLTDGEPQADGAVKSDLLGTIERNDGSTQVTYDGHPLYYYAHEAPGEVKCHNVSTHGGLWWVIQPNGNRAD